MQIVYLLNSKHIFYVLKLVDSTKTYILLHYLIVKIVISIFNNFFINLCLFTNSLYFNHTSINYLVNIPFYFEVSLILNKYLKY